MTIKNLSARFPASRVTVRGLEGLGELARSKWGPYPTVAATFIIGANRGKKGANVTGAFCKTQPEKFTQKTLDDRVQGLRIMSLLDRGVKPAKAEKLYAASRTAQKGWYKGKPEGSASYLIIHDPSIPGEETVPKFHASMKRLAEMASAALCQDEVILSFTSPKGNTGEGFAPDRVHRKAAALRFGKGSR